MALIGEMHEPDVAILPIGGHYTMGPTGAARAAKMLGVQEVVPIHYGTFPILAGTPDELRAELRGDWRCGGGGVARARSRDRDLMVRVRVADPAGDAARVAEIYRPYVEETIISFEEVAPTADQMADRMRSTLAWTPWLVAEDDGRVVGYAYAPLDIASVPATAGRSTSRSTWTLGFRAAGSGERCIGSLLRPAAQAALRQRLRRHYPAQRRERGAASRNRDGADRHVRAGRLQIRAVVGGDLVRHAPGRPCRAARRANPVSRARQVKRLVRWAAMLSTLMLTTCNLPHINVPHF